MQRDLSRLLRPASVAVLGGAWANNVIKQLQKAGYSGAIWPVHPKHEHIRGIHCVARLEDLPGIPDASFIGVNRELTIACVQQLSRMGAGGAVCFASGFLESEADAAAVSILMQLSNIAGIGPMTRSTIRSRMACWSMASERGCSMPGTASSRNSRSCTRTRAPAGPTQTIGNATSFLTG